MKLPGSMNRFFSSLRISVSYSVVGAVISEWLGGFEGLGVYMTRVKKSFAFDKMFAVIFLITAISLLLMGTGSADPEKMYALGGKFMKKKLLAGLLAISAVLSLAGCGEKKSSRKRN